MARLRTWKKRPEDAAALLLWFRDFIEAVKGKKAVRDAAAGMKRNGWSGDPADLSTTLKKLARVFPPAPGETGHIRGGGGRQPVVPTETGGKRLLAFAERLLGLLDELKTSPPAARTVVRVGATDFGLHYLVPKVMAVFLAANPDVDVEFVEGEHWELVGMVRSERVDFAVGPEALSAPGVCPDLLFEMPRALLVPRDFRLLEAWQRGWPGNVDEVLASLVDKTVCLLTEEHNLDFFHQEIVPPPERGGRRITLPSYPHIRSLVRRGLAFALGHAGYETESRMSALALSDPDELEEPAELELPERFGTTPMYLYFRTGGARALRSGVAKSLAGTFKTTFPRHHPADPGPKKPRR